MTEEAPEDSARIWWLPVAQRWRYQVIVHRVSSGGSLLLPLSATDTQLLDDLHRYESPVPTKVVIERPGDGA